jgi:polyhydroxyalkanoate synthesis regulator phasin
MTLPQDESKTPQEETSGERKEGATPRSAIYETTRTILLAGIGAISLAQDEINAFMDRLVERGEMADSEARKLVREVMERREKLERERREQYRKERQAGHSAATRAEVEALTERIADLTRQIEELRRAQQQDTER